MTRAKNLSPEVVDRNGVLLRAYLTKDGYWRIKTTVRDVSPRYLALLKAYEDRRFDDHHGVGIRAGNQRGPEADARRGVAPDRLTDDVIFRQMHGVGERFRLMTRGGQNPGILGGEVALEPIASLLQQRLLSRQG